MMCSLFCIVSALLSADPAQSAPVTTIQSQAAWAPEYDLATDAVMVYGTSSDFAARAEEWKKHGYSIDAMTGVSWGGYDDYYFVDGVWKSGEIQTEKSGKLLMHGNSKTVGYNVPTPEYIEFLKRNITPALDYGIENLYLEEPEFWARAGWSEAFKQEWQHYYNEPWQEPDSSVDAQYKASKLKYHLYAHALDEIFRYAKEYAKSKGYTLRCHVPTHSLINYAHWGIVSPESSLMQYDTVDGYIAQVWTGTARTPNFYRGKAAERTFESAYFEYGQMLAMVKPTGRTVCFLHDPVEDNPEHTWEDYRKNYEATVVASLFWPEVHNFEVMPWPSRIFQGAYTRETPGGAVGDKQSIPKDYATEILTIINALNDFDQNDIEWESDAQGIGIVVSDSMMFQRAAPTPSDSALSSFYGLALPLLKNGIPAQVVQLECIRKTEDIAPYKVLLLTYEGQKPLNPEFHNHLEDWVRKGGCLLLVDDGSDPYHAVNAWWNENGKNDAKAFGSLLAKLHISGKAGEDILAFGKGFAQHWKTSPAKLAHDKDGATQVIENIQAMLEKQGEPLKKKNYLMLRRGPYVIASVLEESLSEAPLHHAGHFVNLFDPALDILDAIHLTTGERGVFVDLDYLRKLAPAAKVIAASTRIREESFKENTLTFTVQGPNNTPCKIRILAPAKPKSISISPEQTLEKAWDEASSTLLLTMNNAAQLQNFQLKF